MATESRRMFLRNTLVCSAGLCFFNPLRTMFAARAGYTLPGWTELVEYARWCPTVHNLQPHKIRIISETEADLYYDPARLLAGGDPSSIFAAVAMGVFIEHLSVAAAHAGAAVIAEEIYGPIDTQKKEFTRFARLKLVSSWHAEVLSRDLIQKRRTSRLHYDGSPLRKNVLDLLSAEVSASGHEFFSSCDPEISEFLIGLNQQALFEDLSSRTNCNELDSLFRYNAEEAAAKKDGLWSKCMGFSGPLMKSVFRNPEQWHRGLRQKLLAKHYKSSFKGTRTICWFGGRFENTADWLAGGRMLARTWLLLTKENAYIQPFGSLITNDHAYGQINAKLTQPQAGKKIWFLFRAGYCREPARSYRLSTDEIII